MRRAVFVVAVAALAGPSAAAQWGGVPVWNSPKGGSGVTIAGDYTRSNVIGSNSNAIAGRVSLGVGTTTVTVGASSWQPESFNTRVTSLGGSLALRLIGGSRLPVAVNLQLGGAYNNKVTSGTQTLPEATTAQGAVGLSTPLPVPLIRVEPYFSPGVRYHRYWNVPVGARKDETNFGWVVGGNIGFGPIAVHIAYDSEKFASGTAHHVIGIGVSLEIGRPLGT